MSSSPRAGFAFGLAGTTVTERTKPLSFTIIQRVISEVQPLPEHTLLTSLATSPSTAFANGRVALLATNLPEASTGLPDKLLSSSTPPEVSEECTHDVSSCTHVNYTYSPQPRLSSAAEGRLSGAVAGRREALSPLAYLASVSVVEPAHLSVDASQTHRGFNI